VDGRFPLGFRDKRDRAAPLEIVHRSFGATLIGRYVSKLKEQGGNTLQSRFYTDAQLRFTPSFWDDRFGFAVGANNIFNTKAPGCVTCDINNFDPTVYDVPGRYYYAKVSVKM